MDMKDYLTAAAFARIIKKDPKTVVNWIKKGWIRKVKRVGKQYQIPLREIETYNNSEIYPVERR